MSFANARPLRQTLHLVSALMWSKRSVCKRQQNGAIITSGDLKRVLAVGYNGPAKRLSHDRCSGQQGSCGCLHAEENALLQLRTNEVDKVMFCTTAPCQMCAQRIAQSDIREVFYLRKYRSEEGLEVLKQCGIPHILFPVSEVDELLSTLKQPG